MTDRSSIFDMIGPVMIGPSSSHTAGVVRIGRVARKILGQMPVQAKITFYNSFAATYEGHGSDRAVIAGLMDMPTDDKRIPEAMHIAKAAGMKWEMKSVASASVLHPNSIRIQAQTDTRQVEIIGISRGGGLISIIEVDGFKAHFTTADTTLIITAKDVAGSIAFISDVIAHDDCNIATMTVSRRAKNDLARLIIEMDSPLRAITLEYLKTLNWVTDVVYIPNLDYLPDAQNT